MVLPVLYMDCGLSDVPFRTPILTLLQGQPGGPQLASEDEGTDW